MPFRGMEVTSSRFLTHNFVSNVRCWHSADTSALPHPGIIKLSFDIPYQLLLIPF
ncbi:Uncharacterised protein [Klebsiella pneumoniae]|nr:Uncharacterised protein [Klebsiella pneumoniae]SWZ92307.1 Uncharacterised protein [Klebsiella pneumoniae]